MRDGERSIDLVPFAHAFGIPFRPDPLRRRLARCKLLGDTNERAVLAEFILAQASMTPAERADYLEREEARCLTGQRPRSTSSPALPDYRRQLLGRDLAQGLASAVQPGCLCRRPRRPVAPGALAARGVQIVAGGHGPAVLLVGPADRAVLSSRRPTGAAHRADQHDGVHPSAGKPLSDRHAVRGGALAGRCVATDAQPALANGCADAYLVRHGNGHAVRAPGGGEV